MLDIDQERRNISKRIRAEVRLKHSISADVEIREVLPRLQAEFELALQQGKLLELQPGTLTFYIDDPA